MEPKTYTRDEDNTIVGNLVATGIRTAAFVVGVYAGSKLALAVYSRNRKIDKKLNDIMSGLKDIHHHVQRTDTALTSIVDWVDDDENEVAE